MFEIKQSLVVPNKYSRPQLPLREVLGFVLHWTATPGATDESEKRFFDGLDGGGSRYASAHVFVDRDSSTQLIPYTEMAYHANDKPCKIKKLGTNANRTTIGLEMCVEKDGTIHPDTIKNAVIIMARWCRQFHKTENDIYRHYDITGKNCPAPFVAHPELFEKFKKDVAATILKANKSHK